MYADQNLSSRELTRINANFKKRGRKRDENLREKEEFWGLVILRITEQKMDHCASLLGMLCHSLTTPSVLLETSFVPSGEKERVVTSSLCSSRVIIFCPVTTFQRLIAPLTLPVTKRLLSGENTARCKSSANPRSDTWLVATSQRRSLRSWPPVASNLPSGENAI